MPAERPAWWKGLTPYMWWVFIVAGLGWLFDVMDQRIFVQSRGSALDELLSVRVEEERLARWIAGEVRAGEVERFLGAAQGIDPQAAVVREAPQEPGKRARLVLPALRAGGEARRLSLVENDAGTFVQPEAEKNNRFGRIATAIFLAGWASGGLLFGILGDKWGRAFTMVLTILIYALFTGLSALSVSWVDYSIYRFLTGMGVGGEFAAGAALVAEVMPARSRPYALGLLQALSALGNITGSLVSRFVLPPHDATVSWDRWRALYLVGVLPALLVLAIRGRLREPERWVAVKKSTRDLLDENLGAFGDLFGPRLRRSTVSGLLLGTTGVIGLWGVGFWTPELVKGMGLGPGVAATATALQDAGAFLGVWAVTLLTEGARRQSLIPSLLGFFALGGLSVGLVALGGGHADSPYATGGLGMALAGSLYFASAVVGAITGGLGRRKTFVVSFFFALLATIAVFRYLREPGQVYWMLPLLGFCTLLCFGMYAIYFPELYPTRVRTTGSSFCYNVARYLAAGGLFVLSWLGSMGVDFRTSTQVFAMIYVLGIVVAPFAPETKGKPLTDE